MGLAVASAVQWFPTDLDESLKQAVVLTTETAVFKIFFTADDINRDFKNFLAKEGVPESCIKLFFKKVDLLDISDEPSTLAENLPGMNLKAKNPVTGKQSTLRQIIIDLNDNQKWSREAIADWIDNTFDIDQISFPTPEVKNGSEKLSEFARVVTIKRILPG